MLRFPCPHCSGEIEVAAHEINCGIFRHAVFKETGEPIPPHASKADIEQWEAEQKLEGCGKPFRVVSAGVAEACDYI